MTPKRTNKEVAMLSEIQGLKDEVKRLLKIITDEREQIKHTNLKIDGFKRGVQFVLQNLSVTRGNSDDY